MEQAGSVSPLATDNPNLVCDRESRTGTLRVKEQAMARADVQGPTNSVVLKGNKEKEIRSPFSKKP